MTTSENPTTTVTNATDKPLLIYKTGALGDTPLDFPGKLAEEYEAVLVSSDEIRRDLLAGDIPNVRIPTNPRDIMKRIRGIGRQRVQDALEEGDDVVLDMFVNSPRTRQELAWIAQGTGALTIATLAHTPFAVAIERVQEWTREDAFVIPVSQWEITPEHAARSMMSTFRPPAAEEEIDFVFRLNGTMPTPDLLDQFAAQMEEHGLVDTSPIEG